MSAGTGGSAIRRVVCPTLVGRDAELAALDAALADAFQGKGRTVLLGGDAGVGKSRLLAEFLGRARTSGAQILVGQCVEAEARRPFGPFFDALGPAGEIPRPQEDRSDALTDPDVRYRTLRSFASAFATLARRSPVVLIIEDLHWADEGSLELFSHLARALRERMVLVVGTYRTDELHRLHPLRPTMADLTRARLADTVTLKSLTAAQTGELIRATLDARRVPKDLVETIFERSEGNPFFTEEILKALIESDRLVLQDGEWRTKGRSVDLVLPESVRDALQDRFAALSEDARRILRTAAVVGAAFDFDPLRRLTGMSDEVLTAALGAAVAAQLIEEVGPAAPDTFRFRHALVRESVLADLLARERRSLHREVAFAIASAGGDVERHADELAYHYDEAGMVEEALRYHDIAAERSVKVFAFAQAKRHLARALELATDPSSLADLHLRFAHAALRSGDGHAALRAAEEAAHLYRARDDARGIAGALYELAECHRTFGEYQRSKPLYDEAVRLLEPFGESPELAHVELRSLAQQEGDREAAVDRVIDLGRRLGLPDVEAQGLRHRGFDLELAGRYDEYFSALQAAHAISIRSGSPDDVIWSFLFLMSYESDVGSPPADRRRWYEQALAYAEEHAYMNDQLLALQVEQAIADGDFDSALRTAGQIVAGGVWNAEVDLRIALIRVSRRGPEAMPDLDAVRRRLMAGPPIWRGFAATSAQVQLLAEDPRRALEHAEFVSERLSALLVTRQNVDIACVVAVEAARRLGDDAAIERWSALAQTGTPKPVESRQRQARRAYGAAVRAQRAGDLDQAVHHASKAAEVMTGGEWPFVETIARLHHAELLLERAHDGDVQTARAELERVVGFWRKVGATWYLGRLAEWAKVHSLPFPAATGRRVAGKMTLTGREREIAGLVAEGFTNRQIAEKLVISERTVESHVERVMDKFGVRSRAEIAARVTSVARA